MLILNLLADACKPVKVVMAKLVKGFGHGMPCRYKTIFLSVLKID